LIDIPVGPTAKVRDLQAVARLTSRLVEVGKRLGLEVSVLSTDGRQPVGRGIGPSLEARDVLQVLQVAERAPQNLRERALLLAGNLLEMGGAAALGDGLGKAKTVLDSGAAWAQFQAICEAQGGMRAVPQAPLTEPICAERSGIIAAIDNRVLARIAKLAGAPQSKAAGVDLHVKLGERIVAGQPLFIIHAEAPGELDYALAYAGEQRGVITVKADDAP
jgi:thymidine phosphorylase